MRKLFRFLFAAAAVFLVMAVLVLFTTSWGGMARLVDAVSVDQFLVNKRALYEALNERMLAPPEGAVLGQTYEAAWKPRFQLWPTDDYIRVVSGGEYTYQANTQFVLDLEHSTLPLDDKMWNRRAADALIAYYMKPLADQGFERNGNGSTVGKTQFATEHWARPSDPTLAVDIRIFVAPAYKEAVVTIEISERLAK